MVLLSPASNLLRVYVYFPFITISASCQSKFPSLLMVKSPSTYRAAILSSLSSSGDEHPHMATARSTRRIIITLFMRRDIPLKYKNLTPYPFRAVIMLRPHAVSRYIYYNCKYWCTYQRDGMETLVRKCPFGTMIKNVDLISQEDGSAKLVIHLSSYTDFQSYLTQQSSR